MICFQRALAATVRAVGGLLVLLYGALNLQSRLHALLRWGSSKHIANGRGGDTRSVDQNLTRTFINNKNGVSLLAFLHGLKQIAKHFSTTVEAFDIHFRSVTGPFLQSNGRLVLAHAGGK